MGYPTFGLKFEDLRDQNLARCARWHPEGINSWTLADWMVATLGELGEASNYAKKMKRAADGLVGNKGETVEELRDLMADEIADTAIYLDLLAASQGIDLAEAIRKKFNEVSDRNGFPETL